MFLTLLKSCRMIPGIARSKIYGTPILHFFLGYNSLPVRIVYPVFFVPLFISYELIINVNNLGTRTIQNYCYLHFFVCLYGAARHKINFNLPFPFFLIFGNISFYYIERWGQAKCVGVADSHCSLFCTRGSFVRDKIDSILVIYC